MTNPPTAFDAQTLNTYLSAALEIDNDTRAARLQKIFKQLRVADISTIWHSIPGLRAFLKDHMLDNPYIVEYLRKIWEDSKSIRQDAAGFFEDWKAKVGPIGTLTVTRSEFMQTIDALPVEKEKFIKNNLHDHAYFF